VVVVVVTRLLSGDSGVISLDLVAASSLLIWWRRQLSGEQRKKICESGLMIPDPQFS
jgi:hypothetical protein